MAELLQAEMEKELWLIRHQDVIWSVLGAAVKIRIVQKIIIDAIVILITIMILVHVKKMTITDAKNVVVNNIVAE